MSGTVLVELPAGDPVVADFLEASGHLAAAMVVRGRATASLLAVCDANLDAEKRRREVARNNGRCDVCGAWHDEPTCGSPRHGAASLKWYRRWKFEWGSSYLEAHADGRRSPSVSVSRYGVSVRLYSAGESVETELPTDYADEYPRSNLGDTERLRWAIDWAISELANRAEASITVA